MRRIARYTLNALTALSLLLCVATVGLWVASPPERRYIGSIVMGRSGQASPMYGGVPWYERRYFVPAVATAALPAVVLLLAMTRPRPGAIEPDGLCPRCGYDLRATPDRCPECGTAKGAG